MQTLFSQFQFVTGLLTLVAGWFVTRRAQAMADRAKNTHNYKNILDNDKLRSQLDALKDYWIKPRPLDLENAGDARSEQKKAIWALCQHLEQVSIDIASGYISEKFYYKQFRTFTQHAFLIASSYISDERAESKSSTYFKNFEIMFLRQHLYPRPISFWVIEELILSPKFRLSSNLYSAHIRTGDAGWWKFIVCFFRGRPLPSKIKYTENLRQLRRTYSRRVRTIRRAELLVAAALVVGALLLWVTLNQQPATAYCSAIGRLLSLCR